MTVPLPSSRRTTLRGADKGFTLIELLVVIAIIAILAAILFPVFAQARAKARQTVCLSNSKQIALAVAMYTQDFDECLPYAINGPNNGSSATYITWDEAFYPYTKNDGVYACPSHETPKRLSNGTYLVSYITNSAVIRTNTNGTTQPYALAKFDAPANTIAMVESNITSNYQAFLACSGGLPLSLTDVIAPTGHMKTRVAWNRHNEGANYVFLDGHAKWHRLEQTVTPTWLYGPCN
ncbi:MAG TPA: prepilin-type N-terminal cleavage/methylation domain-containing protein [Armatimonadaceae bacterium]|nr:prepilin-type N-terminal cleavage/methylation domain-containing protein [Armatimonadaceae bacterium]